MAGNRRLMALVGALAVAIAVAMWSWSGGSSGTAPPAAGQTAPGRPGAAAQNKDPALVDVKLEALSAERPALDERGRNPFQFQGRTTPVSAGPQPETGAPAPVAPVVPSGPPPPPPIALKFIGLVEKGGRKMAVLSGSGYTVIGEEGKAIDGRYRILKIGVESLEIAYLDGRGRQTIRLTGQ